MSRKIDSIIGGESKELPLQVPKTTDENPPKPIPRSEIEATVERLLANGGKTLHKEYEKLKPRNPSKPTEEAKTGNIQPIDGVNTNIEAPYIPGFDKPEEFIAYQVPKGNEKDVFWRMVWERNVHVIVIITNCVKSKMEKCCKYWPEATENKVVPLNFSRLRVKTKMEDPCTAQGYVYRKIKLSKGPSLLAKHRYVKHFQYTMWPNLGCPKDPGRLIDFVTRVKKAVTAESSHIVVHCCAGVGRTATFIALYNLMEEMKAKNSVDVFQAVYNIRQSKESMVPTQDQYSFLYKCILKHHQATKDQDMDDCMEDSNNSDLTVNKDGEKADCIVQTADKDCEKAECIENTADMDCEKAECIDQTADKDCEKAECIENTADTDGEKAENFSAN